MRQGFENCREALGWDHDIMVHCHWEYDLRTAMQIAAAVESIKPLWFEDPLQVEYSEEWSKLCQSARVPICTGENLARRQGFRDFIVHHGCDIQNPDLRNTGGFLEAKRIADMADVFGLPIANHKTGSQLHTWATCQWAASIRDYMTCETITGTGGWMDQLLLLDGPYIKNGFVQVTDKPGLGAELNPDVVKAHLAPGETWWGGSRHALRESFSTVVRAAQLYLRVGYSSLKYMELPAPHSSPIESLFRLELTYLAITSFKCLAHASATDRFPG